MILPALDEHTGIRVDFFNLDVIISVGYRVKSHRGTQFRIWATDLSREFFAVLQNKMHWAAHGHPVGRYISHERIVEQTKESYYEVLKNSSHGWHEKEHDIFPWFNYLLSTLRTAYREFEDRAGRQRPVRGAKSELVEYALKHVTGPFGIADIERLCPNVSREMIRKVMNRWRSEGRLEMLGKGRDARWQRKD